MSWSARVGARREPRPLDAALDELRAAWRADPPGRDDIAVFARAVQILREGLSAPDTAPDTTPDTTLDSGPRSEHGVRTPSAHPDPGHRRARCARGDAAGPGRADAVTSARAAVNAVPDPAALDAALATATAVGLDAPALDCATYAGVGADRCGAGDLWAWSP